MKAVLMMMCQLYGRECCCDAADTEDRSTERHATPASLLRPRMRLPRSLSFTRGRTTCAYRRMLCLHKMTFLANVNVCNVRAPYSGGSNFRQYFYGIRYLGHPL